MFLRSLLAGAIIIVPVIFFAVLMESLLGRDGGVALAVMTGAGVGISTCSIVNILVDYWRSIGEWR